MRLFLVVLVCLEHEGDVRRFMIKAHSLGLTTKDYVFLLPDYVRDANRTDIWTDFTMTGVDKETAATLLASREGFKYTIFVSRITCTWVDFEGHIQGVFLSFTTLKLNNLACRKPILFKFGRLEAKYMPSFVTKFDKVSTST